jgi:hypothetical protein
VVDVAVGLVGAVVAVLLSVAEERSLDADAVTARKHVVRAQGLVRVQQGLHLQYFNENSSSPWELQHEFILLPWGRTLFSLDFLRQFFTWSFQSHVCFSMSKARPAGQLQNNHRHFIHHHGNY